MPTGNSPVLFDQRECKEYVSQNVAILFIYIKRVLHAQKDIGVSWFFHKTCNNQIIEAVN